MKRGGGQNYKTNLGSGGIWTHASEETDALNQRLRPLGHATMQYTVFFKWSLCK